MIVTIVAVGARLEKPEPVALAPEPSAPSSPAVQGSPAGPIKIEDDTPQVVMLSAEDEEAGIKRKKPAPSRRVAKRIKMDDDDDDACQQERI